jgi:hypothetical protein
MSAALTIQSTRALATPGRARSIAALAVGIAVTLTAVVVAPYVVLVAAVLTLAALGVVALGRAAQPLFEHVGDIAR